MGEVFASIWILLLTLLLYLSNIWKPAPILIDNLVTLKGKVLAPICLLSCLPCSYIYLIFVNQLWSYSNLNLQPGDIKEKVLASILLLSYLPFLYLATWIRLSTSVYPTQDLTMIFLHVSYSFLKLELYFTHHFGGWPRFLSSALLWQK